jgi:crossover junction endodeoxyribonuclease RuvC
MNIIGIDPGASGGIASMSLVNAAWEPPVALKLDGTEKDISDFLGKFSGLDSFCYLERVSSNFRADGSGRGGKGMFAFGQGYGFLRGLLIAHRIPFEEVLPAKWQAVFGLKRTDKDESGTDKKNRHKAKCQQLFPQLKITHATADAILLAEYGRRLRSHLPAKETA